MLHICIDIDRPSLTLIHTSLASLIQFSNLMVIHTTFHLADKSLYLSVYLCLWLRNIYLNVFYPEDACSKHKNICTMEVFSFLNVYVCVFYRFTQSLRYPWWYIKKKSQQHYYTLDVQHGVTLSTNYIYFDVHLIGIFIVFLSDVYILSRVRIKK